MLKLMRSLTGRPLPELKWHVCLSLLESLLAGFPFVLLYFLVVELLGKQPRENLLWLACAGIFLCQLLRMGLAAYSYKAMSKFSYRCGSDIRLRLFDHLRRLSMGYFNRIDAGYINTVVTQDMEFTERLFSYLYAQILAVTSTLLLILTALAWVDWRMTLVMVVSLPLAVPLYLWLNKLSRRQADKVLSGLAEVNMAMLEYLQGIKVLRAFSLTGSRFARLDESMRNLNKQALKMELLGGLAPVSFSALVEVGFPLLLVFGSWLLLNQEIQLAEFLLFLILSVRFYRPLLTLSLFAAEMGFMTRAGKRLQMLLDEKPMSDGRALDFDHSAGFRLSDVSFSYDGRPVLHNISATLPCGSVTALVGPSGSGKTTLTNLVARFWDQDSGVIEVGGRPVTDWPVDYLMQHIAMVFQQVYLFEDSILNNLKLANDQADRESIERACRQANCHDFITALPQGYDTQIGEGGARLSGGEKQRISIARALLKDAPIILLDEATASLDPENERDVQQAFEALVKGKTLVIIAHKLSTVVNADQILVMDQGRIVERGVHSELLEKDGLYASLWRTQVSAKQWRLSR